ncbi:MerR family transcriptional regulator [Methylomarinovum tepidoasis]
MAMGQAAERLGVATGTLRRWARSGRCLRFTAHPTDGTMK